MRKILSLLVSSALLAASLISLSSPSASAVPTLKTCTNLGTGKTLVLRSTEAECRSHLGSALWVQEQSDTASRTGAGYASITICSSKNPLSTYRFIKDSCPNFQVSTNYWRTVAPPATPIIQTASARGHDSAALFITPATSAPSAPVLYYLVTDMKSGLTSKVMPRNFGYLNISGLSAESTYSFTIAAVSVDGTSLPSSITPVITTGAVPVVAPTAAPLAAPAFTLSSPSETKTVNNAITGYTITSSGGAIASYSISPAAPAGLTFSTSTGLLSGTPTSVASATAYTITATNASGSATRTFTLTVTSFVYAVGDTGPGGGTIFYVATTPFACGPARASTCTYLEAAPSGWNTGGEPTRTWAQSTPVNYQSQAVNNGTSPETATATAIGWGFRNTRAIILQGNTVTATSAAALADSHTVTVSGVIYGDWYLPSKDELNQMCKWQRGVAWTSDATVCSGGTLNSGVGAAGFVGGNYWSSSEGNDNGAWIQSFFNGGAPSLNKAIDYYVRPVRAF